jgi:hypothetical protein
MEIARVPNTSTAICRTMELTWQDLNAVLKEMDQKLADKA